VQLALHVMRTSGLSPKGVVQSLRPAELTYLCEICAILHELGICDDVFDFEDEEDE